MRDRDAIAETGAAQAFACSETGCDRSCVEPGIGAGEQLRDGVEAALLSAAVTRQRV